MSGGGEPKPGAAALLDLDWDDLKIVLAVAEHGSLTRAARALRLAQPSVGRRLSAFEARCGVELFERLPTGLRPTLLGSELLDDLRHMQELAASVQRRISGQDRALAGEVVISTTAWFGSHIITPLLSRFLADHPAITLEIRAGVREHSLTKREADIAIRAKPFKQDSLIQRKVGAVAFGLFASKAYLEETGPVFADDGAGQRLVALTQDESQSDHGEAFANLLTKARIVWRTDNSEALLRAAEAGVGLALLPVLQAAACPALVQVPTPEPLEARPIWLGYHPELRNTPRIRAVVDHLTAAIPQLAGAPPIRGTASP